MYEYHAGLRAYDAYIQKLQSDDEYPLQDTAVLMERKMVHYDAMTMISERGNGAQFVREAADHPELTPGRKELMAAADAFEESGHQMHGWWTVAGKIWSDEQAQLRATADPEIRRAFVPYVQKSRVKDQEAATLISEAKAKINRG